MGVADFVPVPVAVPVFVRVTVTVEEVEGVVRVEAVRVTLAEGVLVVVEVEVTVAVEDSLAVMEGEEVPLGVAPGAMEGLAVEVADTVELALAVAVEVGERVSVEVVLMLRDCMGAVALCATLPVVVLLLLMEGVALVVLVRDMLCVTLAVKQPEEEADCVVDVEALVVGEAVPQAVPLKEKRQERVEVAVAAEVALAPSFAPRIMEGVAPPVAVMVLLRVWEKVAVREGGTLQLRVGEGETDGVVEVRETEEPLMAALLLLPAEREMVRLPVREGEVVAERHWESVVVGQGVEEAERHRDTLAVEEGVLLLFVVETVLEAVVLGVARCVRDSVPLAEVVLVAVGVAQEVEVWLGVRLRAALPLAMDFVTLGLRDWDRVTEPVGVRRGEEDVEGVGV